MDWKCGRLRVLAGDGIPVLRVGKPRPFGGCYFRSAEGHVQAQEDRESWAFFGPIQGDLGQGAGLVVLECFADHFRLGGNADGTDRRMPVPLPLVPFLQGGDGLASCGVSKRQSVPPLPKILRRRPFQSPVTFP